MSVNPENVINFTVQSNTVAKTIKHYDETDSHEDRHRNVRPRVTSAAEDKFFRVTSLREIAAQINASQNSSNRHTSTSTVQRRLCESGLHGQISAKKPLLKDTNKKKRDLLGPKNRNNGH